MGIIRNSANRKIKGRIGDTTYYVSMNRQIARQALNSSNYGESARRSPSQQGRRVMFANLVNFYKASKNWMSKAFETKSAKQTDYNRFMSANIPTARIALTKAMASVSACVADSFVVSQGSLRSIMVVKNANIWSTDISVGDLTIGATTTIAELTSEILANNNWLLEGDQISFVSYQQYTDAQSIPHVICTAYELTLSTTSSALVRNYLPEFCSQTTFGGMLGTNDKISLGAFAYIISRNLGGGSLQVSTQRLITNNSELISQYSSDTAVTAAIDSYGVDAETFLDTGSTPVSSTGQPLYITEFVCGTKTIRAGATNDITIAGFAENGVTIKLSKSVASAVQSLRVQQTASGEVGEYEDIVITDGFTTSEVGDTVSIDKTKFEGGNAYPSGYALTMIVTFANGQSASAVFKVGSQSVD